MSILKSKLESAEAGPSRWNLNVSVPALLGASLLGGFTLFRITLEVGGVTIGWPFVGPEASVAAATPTTAAPVAVPAPTVFRPDRKLWDRLGLAVEDDDRPGVAIVAVRGQAELANVTTAMRLVRVAASVPGGKGPDGTVLPAEAVATVEQAESALRRAIGAGESRGLEELTFDLGLERSGPRLVTHSFPIPLSRLLPSP